MRAHDGVAIINLVTVEGMHNNDIPWQQISDCFDEGTSDPVPVRPGKKEHWSLGPENRSINVPQFWFPNLINKNDEYKCSKRGHLGTV